jgi:glutamate transport system permease protein
MTDVLFDVPGPRARARSRWLSIVGGVLIAAVLGWVIYTLAQPRESGAGVTLPGMFDGTRWDIFRDVQLWRFVGQGIWNTLRAALLAAALSVALGMLLSLLRSARAAWVRVPTIVFIEFFRGLPVLLLMLFILLAGGTGEYWAVVAALALYNGTLIGEILRSGLVALPKGQREAGLSLGMRSLQTRLVIEFPQAFRQMLPIIVAQLVVLLKDTSLGYIVGYPEILRATLNNLSAYYGNRYLFPLWAVTVVIYLAMNLSLSWLARRLGKRRVPKGGRPQPPNRAMLAAQAFASARQAEDDGAARP